MSDYYTDTFISNCEYGDSILHDNFSYDDDEYYSSFKQTYPYQSFVPECTVDFDFSRDYELYKDNTCCVNNVKRSEKYSALERTLLSTNCLPRIFQKQIMDPVTGEVYDTYIGYKDLAQLRYDMYENMSQLANRIVTRSNGSINLSAIGEAIYNQFQNSGNMKKDIAFGIANMVSYIANNLGYIDDPIKIQQDLFRIACMSVMESMMSSGELN